MYCIYMYSYWCMFSYHVFDNNSWVPPYTWQESTLLLKSNCRCLCGGWQGHSQSCTKCYVRLIVLEPSPQRPLQTGPMYCVPLWRKDFSNSSACSVRCWPLNFIEKSAEGATIRSEARKRMSSDTYERMRPVIKTGGRGDTILTSESSVFMSSLSESH